MSLQKNTFTIIALLFSLLSFSQHTIQFVERTFWKGDISIRPHSLYKGSGLASDGSFFLGDSGNLVRVNLPSGLNEVIVKTIHPEEYAWASVVSPDLKQIAYSWFNGNFFDLMVVVNSVVSGGKRSVPKRLIEGARGQTATPFDWSPDGKWILISLVDTDWIAKIALVSPQDGSVKVLKNLGKQLFNKISFSPDGTYIIYEGAATRKSLLYVMNIEGTVDDRLLSDSTFWGMAPYWSPNGRSVYFLSEDHDSLRLFSVAISSGKAIGSPILVKRNIDFFAPLGFLKDGSFLYGTPSPIELDVYVAEIDTATQKIVTPPRRISNRFPKANLDVILSSDGKRLAYKSGRSNGKEVIVIKALDSGDEVDLLVEHGSLVQWFPDNISLLVVRIDEKNGMKRLFRLDSETGKMDLLVELSSDYQNSISIHHPILSANGSLIYYIEDNRNLNSSQLHALDIKTKQEIKIASFDSPDITSFSASPDGQYLSMVVLYQQQKGRPSALQLLNLSSGEKRELFKTRWGDATKFFGLGWSHDAKYIYYVRSDTATAGSVVWRIRAEGGVPEKTKLTMTDIRMPQIHADGKHIFFYGGKGWYNKSYEIRAINPK